MFFHIKSVELYSPRFGKMQGVLYKDGQIAGNKIEPIDGILKRGAWSYELNDSAFTEQQVKLDNGVTMDLGYTQQLLNEKKEFLSKRKKSIQWSSGIDQDDEDFGKPKKVVPVKGKGGAKGAVAAKKK